MNMPFLKNIPPFIFFTGKGGVGKTSLACATAVWLADQGKRTLLVSTDPASNVGQVFSQTIGHRITDISTVENLAAMEVDPMAAAQAVTNGAIVIHTQRLKSDPGGNLLS
ncbi:ArsA-related P-loop ATPase [Escherichia coli]|uniref:ArsA-related P-loop ATPase n=1 Tax=Escherichia coli TaxID=562 RepID=UPI003D9A8F08